MRAKATTTIRKKDNKIKGIIILSILAFIMFLLRFPVIVDTIGNAAGIQPEARQEVVSWSVILFKIVIGALIAILATYLLPVLPIIGALIIIIGIAMIAIGSIDVFRKTQGKDRVIND